MPAMTIGHAYYTAIVIANTNPVKENRSKEITEQSNAVAQKFPLEYNGVCTSVIFPDGSRLAWDNQRGFAHPGN